MGPRISYKRRAGGRAAARAPPPMAHTGRRWGSFPTTADVGIWARGRTAGELFEALGLGLTALATDLRRVRPAQERTLSASAPDLEQLVVEFLTQLIILQESEGFVPRELTVRTIGSPPTALLATARGEPLDPKRHAVRMHVKAATLHGMSIDLRKGLARLIVDI
jgi:protein archease